MNGKERIEGLGFVIASLRADMGLTVAELSRKTGINEKQLHQWESGDVVPSEKNLHRLATVLPIYVEGWLDDLREYMKTKRKTKLRQPKEQRKKSREPRIGEVCRATVAMGMTYGDFVSKYSPDEIRRICKKTEAGHKGTRKAGTADRP